MKYILAIDQGTTSTRAILFGENGNAAAQCARPHRQIYPEPGWVSHDAEEIFNNVVETVKGALGQVRISPRDVLAIGITNQRETAVLWDARDGKPIGDAVVWQCRRTAEMCAKAEADGIAGAVRSKTGLLIDPYFSATKIKWMLENYPEARRLARSGNLRAGTMDSFLIWKLTGGSAHVTDYTNASRTMLFNINSLEWDKDLLSYFNVEGSTLPEVVSCAEVCGYTDEMIFGARVPIAGVAGDQHAALFGQACFETGEVKNTYGTGCFILKNIGSAPIITESRLLTTVAWHINGKACYAFEGSVFCAGAALEWLMNDLKLAGGVEEINSICETTPDTCGAYFVPAFTGLGAPYWDMRARGILCGLTLSANKNHVVRAVAESIAYGTRDVTDHMAEVSGIAPKKIKADGGVSRSDFLMQFQSDLLGIDVERPRFTETTACGVFYLAGLGAGLYGGLGEIVRLRETERLFTPSGNSAATDEKYSYWLKAVERSRSWTQ